MSGLAKMLILGVVVLACGAGLVFWKSKVGSHGGAITKVTKEQMEMLVKDLNPMQQRMLAENEEQKKELAKNIKEFLAIASEARKEGFADKPDVKHELKYMEKAIMALSYDKVKRGDKPMPPLSMITEEQVREFWGEEESKPEEDTKESKADETKPESEPEKPDSEDGEEEKSEDKDAENDKPSEETDAEKKAEPEEKKDEKTPGDAAAESKKDQGFLASALDLVGLGWIVADAGKRRHEIEFKKYLKAQEEIARESGRLPEGQGIPEEQVKQMKELFAKFTIYDEEARSKLGELGEDFLDEVEFQTQLQQSQFLAQMYAREVLVPKLEVKEADIDKYIEEHPDLVKEGREKAEGLLKKAKEGEDFAELAKEFSDDPGSKDKGGLYEKVPKGQMIPAFEKAALALKPGEIAESLVRTKHGYHIIKLEKTGETETAQGKKIKTYDARHILIAVNIKDPDSPMQQEIPVDAYVTNKLKIEKQNSILEELQKKNPIEVATDYEVKPPPIPQQPQLPGGMQVPQQGPPPPPPANNENPDTPKNDG